MTQRNPWLDIPAADYIGHMGSPEVDQLSVLSDVFRDALERFSPANVLLLGCSTGNGLAHVHPSVTRRVTGIDINQEYLTRFKGQFPSPAFELRLTCADVMTVVFEPEAYVAVAEAQAKLILANSQRAIRSAKETLFDIVGRTLEDALRIETLNSYSCLGDFAEARARLQAAGFLK